MDRREFSKVSALGLAGAMIPRSGTVQAARTPTPAGPPSRGAWFQEARFGRFIHFGLYALLGRGEWQMFLDQIPPDEYAKLKDRFNPTQFNAKEWVQLAKDAGQRGARGLVPSKERQFTSQLLAAKLVLV